MMTAPYLLALALSAAPDDTADAEPATTTSQQPLELTNEQYNGLNVRARAVADHPDLVEHFRGQLLYLPAYFGYDGAPNHIEAVYAWARATAVTLAERSAGLVVEAGDTVLLYPYADQTIHVLHVHNPPPPPTALGAPRRPLISPEEFDAEEELRRRAAAAAEAPPTSITALAPSVGMSFLNADGRLDLDATFSAGGESFPSMRSTGRDGVYLAWNTISSTRASVPLERSANRFVRVAPGSEHAYASQNHVLGIFGPTLSGPSAYRIAGLSFPLMVGGRRDYNDRAPHGDAGAGMGVGYASAYTSEEHAAVTPWVPSAMSHRVVFAAGGQYSVAYVANILVPGKHLTLIGPYLHARWTLLDVGTDLQVALRGWPGWFLGGPTPYAELDGALTYYFSAPQPDAGKATAQPFISFAVTYVRARGLNLPQPEFISANWRFGISANL